MLFEFVRQGIRNHTTVGSVLPSSKGLCRGMARVALEREEGKNLRILEVGPGTGPVTGEMLKQLRQGDSLEGVELNPEFCEILKKRFPKLSIHQVSILDFEAPHRFDRIVSGLPLANFPAEMVEAIYKKLFELLAPDGTFIMFHYLGLRHVLRYFGRAQRRQSLAQIIALENQLQPLVVEERDVLLNVPPARITVRKRPVVVEKLLV
jgi:phospholipid N-methyltransferase